MMNQTPENQFLKSDDSVMAECPAPVVPEKSKLLPFFEYFEMFVCCFAVIIALFSTVFSLCKVSGKSMENTLYHNEPLFLNDLVSHYKQDDIIVFQLKDYKSEGERLIKRVIAVGGQTVRINLTTNVITVDGVVYEDEYGTLKNAYSNQITNTYDSYLFASNPDFDSTTQIFETVVPENYLFVMGDNRNNSNDSRNASVGFIDERCVLGKVLLRFRPFTWFGGK